MSLSSAATGGKGVDSNAVDAYDSGDEWDIGVGNLIIDLDADLEKEKLEMSGSKEAGVGPPLSTATSLPDKVTFVTPGAQSKAKSKRSKNLKESAKNPSADQSKRDLPGRPSGEAPFTVPSSTQTKASEKGMKGTRSAPPTKKDKEGASGKSKKEKVEVVPLAGVKVDKEGGIPTLSQGTPRSGLLEAQDTDLAAAEPHGNVSLNSVEGLLPLAVAAEAEEMKSSHYLGVQQDTRDQVASPPAPPPLLLLAPAASTDLLLAPATNVDLQLAPAASADISSSCEQIMVRTRSLAVSTRSLAVTTAHVALATEPECLGPCEPGTSVNLEGIVWQETEDGMLVVNVSWRNKTYVGTLLDCTRHNWAPPRFCESPTSDLEVRGGRGRGKRIRPSGNMQLSDTSGFSDNRGSSKTRAAAAANSSKGRRCSQTFSGAVEESKSSAVSAAKRKSKATPDLEPMSEDTKNGKRVRTGAPLTPPSSLPQPDRSTNSNTTGAPLPLPPSLPQPDRSCTSPTLIDCPHPNCNKKYKHINGLKYHQARAHNLPHIMLEQEGDSEGGEDCSLHPDLLLPNGTSISPVRSTTPKGRGLETHSPSQSPARSLSRQGKKRWCEGEGEVGDCCEEEEEESSDGLEERKATWVATGAKQDKVCVKGAKPAWPPAPGQLYPLHNPPSVVQSVPNDPPSVVQSVPKSHQLKGLLEPAHLGPAPDSPAPSSAPSSPRDKKKKRKEVGREGDSPRRRDGRSPYSESSDPGGGQLNGCDPQQQSRLASIKAEADKVYSFSDNTPSPCIGLAPPLTPLQLSQNGADSLSVKTSSPAYSDISDAGEDGEGKAEGGRAVKVEPGVRDGAKKALFPHRPPSKEPPYHLGYPHPSQGGVAPQVEVKKEEEQESVEQRRIKVEPQEERRPEPPLGLVSQQQLSVIQQRSNMYMPPLYYNQYAYVPPYSCHSHLLGSSPAYRQQDQDRPRPPDRRADLAPGKVPEEWRQKVSVPPTLSKAPSLPDLGSKAGLGTTPQGAVLHAKPKEQPPPLGSEQTKSVIMPKAEEGKAPEPLKMKLSDAGHPGKEGTKVAMDTNRPASMEQAMWYRQEPDARLWPYVYPNKYPEAPRPSEEERWREERGREREKERDRKGTEEKSRCKEGPQREGPQREDVRETTDGRTQPSEEHRGGGKEVRTPHLPFSSPLAQHQAYMPYMQGAYAYSQGYDPNQPGYRGVPPVMIHNYPGSYLSAGYPFSAYGGKVSGGDEAEPGTRSSPSSSSKTPCDSQALELLQHHATHYKSKASAGPEKGPQERVGAEREGERPRSSPSQRVGPSHHHLGYPLLPGQYDLPYGPGLSSSAIVASQQATAPSMYPPARR